MCLVLPFIFQAEGREFEPRFPLIDNEEVSNLSLTYNRVWQIARLYRCGITSKDVSCHAFKMILVTDSSKDQDPILP